MPLHLRKVAPGLSGLQSTPLLLDFRRFERGGAWPMANPAGTSPLDRSCRLGRCRFLAAIAGSLLAATHRRRAAARGDDSARGVARPIYANPSRPVEGSAAWPP